MSRNKLELAWYLIKKNVMYKRILFSFLSFLFLKDWIFLNIAAAVVVVACLKHSAFEKKNIENKIKISLRNQEGKNI